MASSKKAPLPQLNNVFIPSQLPVGGKCRIAFVAETGGYNEAKQKTPLVGRSGELFNRWLDTLGIDREDCYVGNVFSYRPRDNEIQRFFMKKSEAKRTGWDKKCNLTPHSNFGYVRPEHITDVGRMRAELEEVQPEIIIGMGSVSLWALTGLDTIGKHRGVLLETQWDPSIKVLCTWHPAGVMRKWSNLPQAVADISKAQRIIDGKFDEVERTIVIEPSIQDIKDFIKEHVEPLRGTGRPLAVDIETSPPHGQITCIGFAPKDDYAFVIPIWDKSKPNWRYWGTLEEEVEALSLVKEIMEDPEVTKVGQNFCVPGDTEVLTKFGWKRLDRIYDEGEEVAQWKTNGDIIFARALPIKSKGGHSLFGVKSRHHDCTYTSEHTIVWRNKSAKNWESARAKDLYNSSRIQIPTAGSLKNSAIREFEYPELLVAVQADSYLTRTRAVFNLKKKEKIDRLLRIVSECDQVDLVELDKSYKSERSFSLKGQAIENIWKVIGKDKIWPWDIILYNEDTRKRILLELKHWDAKIISPDSFHYFSKHETNLDVIGALSSITLHTSNKLSNKVLLVRNRNYTNIIKDNWYRRPTKSDMFCLKTETGFFVARRKGKTFITGNSYDMQWLRRDGIKTHGEVHDTMLIHHCLEPELEKSLGVMASLYSNSRPWKEMVSFKKTDGGKQDA